MTILSIIIGVGIPVYLAIGACLAAWLRANHKNNIDVLQGNLMGLVWPAALLWMGWELAANRAFNLLMYWRTRGLDRGELNPDIIASKPIIIAPSRAEALRSARGRINKASMEIDDGPEIFARGPNASRPMILETDTDTDTDTAHPPRTRKIVRGLGGISHGHRPGHP